jgi:hypothetical protein
MCQASWLVAIRLSEYQVLTHIIANFRTYFNSPWKIYFLQKFDIQHLCYVDDKTQFSECGRMIWNYDGFETLCPPTNQSNLKFTIFHLPHDYTPHCTEQPYHGTLSLHTITLPLHTSHSKLLPYPKDSFIIK